MNDIRYGQASTTFSPVIVAGLIAMQQVLHGVSVENVTQNVTEFLFQRVYSFGGNNPTYKNYSNSITGTFDFIPIEFEQAVGSFYARLLASQEPLGADFEKILYDNLWDLYES